MHDSRYCLPVSLAASLSSQCDTAKQASESQSPPSTPSLQPVSYRDLLSHGHGKEEDEVEHQNRPEHRDVKGFEEGGPERNANGSLSPEPAAVQVLTSGCSSVDPLSGIRFQVRQDGRRWLDVRSSASPCGRPYQNLNSGSRRMKGLNSSSFLVGSISRLSSSGGCNGDVPRWHK